MLRYDSDIGIGGHTQPIHGTVKCATSTIGKIDASYRRNDRISIPADCMQPVQDAIRGTWSLSGTSFFADADVRLLGRGSEHAVRPGSIVLLVESPHKDEYQTDRRTPIRPLNNCQTKQNLRDRLENMIKDASAILGIALRETDIVLANPVRFQASLANFMANSRVGLQAGIRNAVWRSLFGDPEVKACFNERIRRYDPALILVAPTADLRKPLQQALIDSVFGRLCVDVTPHPCWWHRQLPCACYSRRHYVAQGVE